MSWKVEGRTSTAPRSSSHRSHRVSTPERKQAWQIDGLKKVEQLNFLWEGMDRTLAQAAIKYILAEPAVASVLPNIYHERFLQEFAAAPETPDLTPDDLLRVGALYADQFGLHALHSPS